jgi:hypothetical protein
VPSRHVWWISEILPSIVAVGFAALAVHCVRQSRRAWRERDWHPRALPAPKYVAVQAIILSAFTAMVTGAVLGNSVTDTGRANPLLVLAAAALVVLGGAGIVFGSACFLSISKSGRPRFLVPPRLRAGTGSPQPRAGAQAGAQPVLMPPEQLAAGEVQLLSGPGQLVDDFSNSGFLRVTSRRILLQTTPPEPRGRRHSWLTMLVFGRLPGILLPDDPGQPGGPYGYNRSWLLSEVRAVQRGRARDQLAVSFAGGSEERFVVRDRDRWIAAIDSARGAGVPGGQ